ncbi:hypothetical protein BG011_006803 [Mortierella polycephala]|uniref:F-box domain-containing protein n=1 Tax=Mortierella polycephala TaxID=41804 RepID=A0A9P6U921_9FUNG|nr:hypothetical protein BG011_006803 [Mortierella polycephala]
MSSKQISIFEIPHIQDHICSHLSPQHLRRCVLVCHLWAYHFNPYLWQSIQIRRRSTFKKFARPEAQQALAHKRHHIHTVSSIFAEVFHSLRDLIHHNPSSPCTTNLIAIHSLYPAKKCNQGRIHQQLEEVVLQVVEASPRLQVLKFGIQYSFNPNSVSTNRCLDVIKSHPSLRELHIATHRFVSVDIVRNLLKHCVYLEKLSIHFTVWDSYRGNPGDPITQSQREEDGFEELLRTIRDQEYSTEIVSIERNVNTAISCRHRKPFVGFKELEFRGRIEAHGEVMLSTFLSFLPSLERVVFPCMMRGIEDFPRVIETYLSCLQHLDVSCRANIQIGRITAMVKACRQNGNGNGGSGSHGGLRTFIGSKYDQYDQAFVDALLEHGQTLEHLGFAECDQLKSEMIQALLMACPRLKVFEALLLRTQLYWNEQDPAFMTDTVRPRRRVWACQQLRVLKLQFMGTETHVFPMMFAEQLRLLHMLEDLRLRWKGPQPVSELGHGKTGKENEEEELVRTAASQGYTAHTMKVMNALRALSSLKRLKRLELRGFRLFVDKVEMREMRKQWPQLELMRHD